tara:strand:+ start:1188 stop:1640 length:453 start_codon:yes stop_codon:yes gene_type:complete
MKKTLSIFNPLFLILTFALVDGQTIIANQSPNELPINTGQFEQSIMNPNKFNMNQGFTMMTSMSGGKSQTMGIYSNYSSFKLSERLQFKTGLHLIQSQNNLSYSNGPQTGIGYELGVEYKLSPNSMLTFQLVNYSNSPIRNRNFSPLNVP